MSDSRAVIEILAELICTAYIACSISLFALCWFNLPVLAIFLFSRIARLFDRQFSLRATAPAHAAIHLSATFIFAIVLPTFYIMATRTNIAIGPWRLGHGVNTPWTIAIGVFCIAWICAHLIEACLRLGQIQFTASWIDRGFAALGFALCLWFQVHTWNITLPVNMFGSGSNPHPVEHFVEHWLVRFIYPSLCFGGATLVFGFALLESLRAKRGAIPKRRWKLAIPASVVIVGALFAPFWLSIPRVTHRQAIDLIEEHRASILKCADAAKVDPRLLAGVIYVAQTRDHPRLFGDAMEQFGIELWMKDIGSYFTPEFGRGGIINASAGVCQIRPTTAADTLHLIRADATDWGIYNKDNSSHFDPWQVVTRHLYDDGVDQARMRFAHVGGALERCQSLLPLMIQRDVGTGTYQRTSYQLRDILLTPESNIALATIILTMYDQQWTEAGWPIDDRPEILATLYNIGFKRSNPHGAPEANDFGRRVLAFMESDDCSALFPMIERDQR